MSIYICNILLFIKTNVNHPNYICNIPPDVDHPNYICNIIKNNVNHSNYICNIPPDVDHPNYVRVIDIRGNVTYIVRMIDISFNNVAYLVRMIDMHFYKMGECYIVNHPNYICDIRPFNKI
jgi:hypothetical protein